MQFTTSLLLAIVSGAFAGYLRPSYGFGYGGSYGYGLGGSYAVAGSPVVSRVAAYHAAPYYSGYYHTAPVGLAKYATYHGAPRLTAVAAHPAYAMYRSTPALTTVYHGAPVYAAASTVSGLNRYARYSAAPVLSAYHAVPAVSGFAKYAAYNAAPLATYHAAPAVATYHAAPA
ncbi:unnamed protein product, partial [Ixodes pacificus]